MSVLPNWREVKDTKNAFRDLMLSELSSIPESEMVVMWILIATLTIMSMGFGF